MNSDPEHFTIHPSYEDPVDRREDFKTYAGDSPRRPLRDADIGWLASLGRWNYEKGAFE